MDELVHVGDNKQVVTDSRTVAESFEKRHDHVLRDIENLKKLAPQFWGDVLSDRNARSIRQRPHV